MLVDTYTYDYFLLLKFCLFIYLLSVYVYVCMHACIYTAVRYGGQREPCRSQFSAQCWFRELNSGHQSWQQVGKKKLSHLSCPDCF